MQYGYEKVALCTRGSCRHGPSRHKGIMSRDGDYQGAQEVGECRDCHCVGYDPEWAERFPDEEKHENDRYTRIEAYRNIVDILNDQPYAEWHREILLNAIEAMKEATAGMTKIEQGYQ